MTNYCKKTISHLKAQITQLNQEKAQLRLFLHELVEALYKTINTAQKNSTTQTLNPKLAQVLKAFDQKNPKPKPAHECFLTFMKDFHSGTKTKEDEDD